MLLTVLLEKFQTNTNLMNVSIGQVRYIEQYCNLAPGLSGRTSIFGVVFLVSKSLSGIERHKKLSKIYNFDPKASEPC